MRWWVVAFVASCSASNPPLQPSPPPAPADHQPVDDASAAVACADGIEFADQALERDVRRRIGIEAPAEIRATDVARLRHVGGKLEVESLAGIECLTALESLRFQTYEHAVDLGPLESLPNLESLRIGEASVQSLAPLGSLDELERLELRLHESHDLSVLASLQSLERLALWSFEEDVIDLSPLAALPNLSQVELLPRGVSARVPEGATTLAEAVSGWQPVDVPSHCAVPVRFGAKSLETAVRAQIDERPGARIHPDELVSIRRLRQDTEPIASLAGIECMTGLEVLHVVPAPTLDLAPLVALHNLHELRLVGSAIGDVTPLAELDGLRSLRLRVRKGTSLAPLAQLSRLTRLKLNVEGIVDLGFLRAMDRLRRLEVIHAEDLDLTALASLHKLRSLRLTAAGVVDLAPLAGLSRLQSLSLDLDDLPDLQRLAGLPRLEQLTIEASRPPRPEELAIVERFDRLVEWTFISGTTFCSGSRDESRVDAVWDRTCSP